MNFTKMQGAGNDFIIIDNRENVIPVSAYVKTAQDLCRAKFSIGADGLILVEKSTEADFKMVFINSDGSYANMCGNGARCVAYFAFTNKIAGETMVFETGAGPIKASVNGTEVRINLTKPKDIKLDMNLNIENRAIDISSVNTGVPHVVILTSDVDNVDVAGLGRTIRNHRQFGPEGTNVNFIKVIDEHSIKIRTYERGVEAETYACGTGAVASAVIAGLKQLVTSPVKLTTTGGELLTVYFKYGKPGDTAMPVAEVELEGKVAVTFKGTLETQK
ncbi:MAG: diaminopimelate epimerase [Elusimicrobia bacterium RIFOXYA2_FULL_39_19]|nr:MAG: diaminopimelate epimerase [Elusimicrobia bacterium RIFOXYA2_FULL_39_19]